ncbi:MAG: Ig-like domain-containing protein [Candidatus Dojkabacteria bacterium]
MFTEILKNIGFDNFLIIVLSTIPFFIFVFLDLIILRKSPENKSLKSLIWRNRFFILGTIFVTIIAGFILIAASYFTTIPTIISSKPASSLNWSNYTEPVEIKFNVPVKISALQPKIVPGIQGDWVWERFLLSDYTIKGKFIPSQTEMPEQRIVVYIVGAQRFLIPGENHELALNFLAPTAPIILKSIPSDNASEVERETTFKIYFNKINYYLSDWTYTIDPAIDTTVSNEFADYLEITPKTILAGDTQYKITLQRKPISYDLQTKNFIVKGDPDYTFTTTFHTAKDALIESITPQGTGVDATTTIKVKFSSEMDRQTVEDNFEINPSASGTFTWTDNKSFEFKPNEILAKGQVYTITLKSGITKKDAGATQKDLKYSFETIGAIKVLSFSPTDGAANVNESSGVLIKLDQDVDHASAESSFQITPAVDGHFIWNGIDLIFTPNYSLPFNQTFTVLFKKGVKSIHGIDLQNDVTFSFAIRSQESIVGGVPQLYQPYGSFSCNVYAGLMALSWKGYNLSAAGLISETGYDEGQYNGQWTGDPYVDYVGNSDGSWGYGMYWTALQIPFNNRGIATQIKEGWNVQELAQSILDGHPVIIWRYNGESANYDKNWTASDGTYVHGINGQHGGLVIGVRGSISNPDSFLVNDPWYGQYWYSADYLDYTWSRMNRTAMIVY